MGEGVREKGKDWKHSQKGKKFKDSTWIDWSSDKMVVKQLQKPVPDEQRKVGVSKVK